MLVLPACQKDTGVPPVTTDGVQTTTAPQTDVPQTTAPVSAPDTTAAPPVTTQAPDTQKDPETTQAPETTAPVASTPYVNPLTGLSTETDLSGQRPVAVMINNIPIACPQVGIAEADVLYECLVEGGLTRLMAVILDYKDIPVLGSVRSSRDYYLDMAQNHDAIYIHAGGSPQAYSEIYARGIDYICGVNMYTPNTFYRDPQRQTSMGYEHSLMTSGSRMVSGISFKKYRTEIKADYTSPFVFDAENCSAKSGSEALHLILYSSAASVAQFIYNRTTDTYYRFQFGDKEHIDAATGEQLNFKNVLILYAPTAAVPGDASGRIAVDTVGTGKGYYVTGGKSIPIVWKKDSRDAVMQLTTESGEQLIMTPGKVFVSYLPTTSMSSTVLNYQQ